MIFPELLGKLLYNFLKEIKIYPNEWNLTDFKNHGLYDNINGGVKLQSYKHI